MELSSPWINWRPKIRQGVNDYPVLSVDEIMVRIGGSGRENYGQVNANSSAGQSTSLEGSLDSPCFVDNLVDSSMSEAGGPVLAKKKDHSKEREDQFQNGWIRVSIHFCFT
jgi:hypothetical protein